MNRRGTAPPLARVLGPTVPALVLVIVVLGFVGHTTTWSPLVLVAVGVVGSGAGIGLRASRSSTVRRSAPIPVLAALGFLALETAIAPIPELLVGASGVVFVAWLLDDPSRPPAGVARGAVEWALPGLAVGVAWTSSFLLPATTAPIGVAGALLVGVVVAIAYLVRRPDLFDRAEPTTI
jgi:hypothetical protein